MKKHISVAALLIACCYFVLSPCLVKAAGPDSLDVVVESRMTLNYLCGPLDSVLLSATLLIKRGDNTLALQNVTIDFVVKGESSDVPVGKAITDQEGIARLSFIHTGLPADKDGLIVYTAKYAGSAKYPEAENSFTAKPSMLKLFFSIEDSVKILKVTATQKDAKGESVPIPNETVSIYIPRLFSLLKIGEITLDETGTGTLEFPKEVVGDTLGNLTVLAKIEEHDIFGFVQGKNTINWGVPKQYYKAEVPSRELWTPIAPMWMIITLIIMLLGVWAHYVYAVYELVMIKKLSKKENPKF